MKFSMRGLVVLGMNAAVLGGLGAYRQSVLVVAISALFLVVLFGLGVYTQRQKRV